MRVVCVPPSPPFRVFPELLCCVSMRFVYLSGIAVLAEPAGPFGVAVVGLLPSPFLPAPVDLRRPFCHVRPCRHVSRLGLCHCSNQKRLPNLPLLLNSTQNRPFASMRHRRAPSLRSVCIFATISDIPLCPHRRYGVSPNFFRRTTRHRLDFELYTQSLSFPPLNWLFPLHILNLALSFKQVKRFFFRLFLLLCCHFRVDSDSFFFLSMCKLSLHRCHVPARVGRGEAILSRHPRIPLRSCCFIFSPHFRAVAHSAAPAA
jgi:hypothetical protein